MHFVFKVKFPIYNSFFQYDNIMQHKIHREYKMLKQSSSYLIWWAESELMAEGIWVLEEEKQQEKRLK